MSSACKTVSLIALIALFTAGLAFTQSTTDDATPEAKAAATVAYVYVQTHKGVDVYDAASDGKLTLVKGSPFATTGQMEGVNGKYLISVGTAYVHTYAIEPGGAVGRQVAEINTQDYAGSECGPTGTGGVSNGAILDHSGKYFFVQLNSIGSEANCAVWQSYEVQSDGNFAFLSTVYENNYAYGNAYPSTTPTFSSNDEFAYAVGAMFDSMPFTIVPGLGLQPNKAYTEVGPIDNPNYFGYPLSFSPSAFQAGNANNLVGLMYSFNEVYGFFGPQLASYSINQVTGGITSNNNWKDMPVPALDCCAISMSNSGKLLAMYGDDGYRYIPGLQLFHVNGSNPLTAYTQLMLPTVQVDQVAWDKDNHMYALSYKSQKLYVYTVTPTSIKEASGSPISVSAPYGSLGMTVVPK